NMCLPSTAPPSNMPWPDGGFWTYCITRDSNNSASSMSCPSSYATPRVFGDKVTDTRKCSECTCGPPLGSTCSSTISAYSDDACSQVVGAVVATASQSMCVDIPAGSGLGSKQATKPTYKAGSCQSMGGELTGTA